ncbi:MAG: hypothetical protein PVJ43_05375 [Gemmatimonadales bacterium]|jgi:predicted CXXCH cytochrome family protein
MSSSSRFVRPVRLVALALVPVIGLLGACGERPQPPDSFAVSAATFPDSVVVAWPALANVDSFRADLTGDVTLTKWVGPDATEAVFTLADGVEAGAGYTAAVVAVNAGGETAGENQPSLTANGFPWDEWYPTSLHATGQGLQTFYSATNNGLEQFANVPYWELACKNCHAPSITGACMSCHDTAEPTLGAQVDDGVAEGQACAGCHGRQAAEIAAGFSDVHRDAGMTCMDCHTLGDVMGDGVPYVSKHEAGAIDVRCENCHASPPDNPYHAGHAESVDCSACHMQGLITCYNCHYQTDLPEGASQLLTQVRDWRLLVNRRGKVHPANLQSMIYQGNKLLLMAPGYGHTIARNAVSGCGDCHANSNVLDLDDDSVLVVAGFDGAGSVKTAQGYVPIPFNFETALAFDFLVYDAETEAWSLLSRGQDVTQFMFAQPLSDEQLKKLRQAAVAPE